MMADMHPPNIEQSRTANNPQRYPTDRAARAQSGRPRHTQAGHSLAELCIVLCLTGIAAAMAAPSVSHWLWRSRVENTARAWTADLQSARLQALRTGRALQLQKLTGCADFLPMGDWRCGWQVITAGSKPTATLQHALNGELSVVLFPANDFLPINTQGEPVAGGLRLQVMTRNQPSPVAMSVCMNIAGRLRFVKSGGCT